MDLCYLDTSALAKWYLREPLSEQVEAFLVTLPFGVISSLTGLEMACLLARRRRNGEISPTTEARVTACFQQDIADQHLRMVELADEHVPEALRLIGSLPGHALRTLDALHLAVARSEGLRALATADRIMAAAAAEAGFTVTSFLPETAG